ncbi:hypothetical protein [Paradevosia shaoguanensis]|uniref:hypothetical protein n=1 Tax=Paradevosia shaoguanensis TaxID=1335043 RepID=UPI003C74F1C7
MQKPDEIPQDVSEAAYGMVMSLPVCLSSPADRIVVARAIASAILAERERNARYHDDLAAHHETCREEASGEAIAHHAKMARSHLASAAAIRGPVGWLEITKDDFRRAQAAFQAAFQAALPAREPVARQGSSHAGPVSFQQEEAMTANPIHAELVERLRERYTPSPVPPCRVCGAPLSIQSAGGGQAMVYGCTNGPYDPEHYAESRWVQYRPGDSDVIELVDLATLCSPSPPHAEERK